MSENNQNEVRKEPHVMSRDDVNDYDGLTLNEQGEQEERSAEDSFIHIYMIQASASSANTRLSGVPRSAAARERASAKLLFSFSAMAAARANSGYSPTSPAPSSPTKAVCRPRCST